MAVYKPSLPEIPKLTRAEQHLVGQAVLGEWATFPIDGDEPEAERKTIRPEVLQRLCANPPPEWPVHAHGVQMKGATVSGDLDLEAAIVPHPLDFDDCRIAGQLILRDARTRSIGLEGTSVQGISADRAVIEGALFLRNKFRATGEVRLIGAVIGGVLDCSEGVFEVEEGKERNALNADGLTVKGNVFLKSGFKATGEVRLLNVEIGGNLECSGGVFEVEKGDALSADRATIKGDVFLNDGFKATGEVKLLGAKIGGDLACGGGFFEVKEGAALTVQRLTMNGVFL